MRELSEKEWQLWVLDLAGHLGYISYHTFDSRRSRKGFPDLVLVKPPRVLFVELKSEKGKTSPVQDEWLLTLVQCPGVETYLWRPSDWKAVTNVLQGRTS